MRKTDKVFARIGFEDVTLPIAEMESVIEEVSPQYLIGFEDEHGEECEKDGTYLNQIENENEINFKFYE
jgi:hypothetical protein